MILYIVYAAVCGAIVTKAEDANKAVQPLVYLTLLGLFSSMSLSNNPDGIFAMIMSYIPFLSSFLMPLRLIKGNATGLEAAISLVILFVFLLGSIWWIRKIYPSLILQTDDNGMWKNMKRALKLKANTERCRGLIMNTNSLEKYAINKNKIKINFVNSSLELTILTPEIIRVFQNRGEHTNSYAIEGNKAIDTKFKVEKKNDYLEIKTSKLIIKIYHDEKIDVYDAEENPLIIDYRGSRIPIDRQTNSSQQKLAESEGHEVVTSRRKDVYYYELVKELADDEQFYGLGDKTGFFK